MAVLQASGVRYECCRRCGGVWFGPDDLQTLDLPPDLRPDALKKLAAASGEPGESRLNCGNCGQVLLGTTIEDVRVDLCPGCGAAWLSAGEFERVLDWYKNRKKDYDHDQDGDEGERQDASEHDSQSAESDTAADGLVISAQGADSCGPDENALSAIFDFMTSVCRAVAHAAEGIGDAVSSIDLGDVDFGD